MAPLHRRGGFLVRDICTVIREGNACSRQERYEFKAPVHLYNWPQSLLPFLSQVVTFYAGARVNAVYLTRDTDPDILFSGEDARVHDIETARNHVHKTLDTLLFGEKSQLAKDTYEYFLSHNRDSNHELARKTYLFCMYLLPWPDTKVERTRY